jgi:transcriptional regulator with XRE-family HTH domain
VHVGRRRVPWLAGVDDDHRPALPPELEGSGQPGGRPTDDGHVAVALDRPWRVVVAHALGRYGAATKLHEALRDSQDGGRPMSDANDIDRIVRSRLRSLRTTLGLSLDELAARTHLSPSTISRVETGKRTIGLDVLLPLATALQVDLNALLDVQGDDDVVIRPTANSSRGRTTWLLSRPTGTTVALKMRLEPAKKAPEQRVHPGRDWFFVIDGRVRLLLGEREITVETGEAAEFTTMTPHAFMAIDDPAEVIVIFDRDGQRAHVHQEPVVAGPPATSSSKRSARAKRKPVR